MTAAVEAVSTNGQLVFIAFPSKRKLHWAWESAKASQIDSVTQRDLALLQLQKEYQVLLASLEYQRARARIRRSAEDDVLVAQITQIKTEYGIMRTRIQQPIIAKLWGDLSQSPDELVQEAIQGFPNVSNHWGFGIRQFFGGWAVACPHWFAMLISAAMAMAFAIRRFWRFSLRTLLITTTLVAIMLGVIVIALR